MAMLVGAMLATAPAVEASWGLYPRPPRPKPPDQSWLLDVPEKPGAPPRNKVAVFAFNGDDVYQPVRAAVVRVLRRRGLYVTTTLRPLDNAAQYREMSQAMNLMVYVEGEMSGEGAKQHALIRLYSGVTGSRIASARFSGPTEEIVGDVARTFWTRVGPAVTRARSNASKPRRPGREPLHIDAGDPLDTPLTSEAEGT